MREGPLERSKGTAGAAYSAQETTSGADGLYRPNNTRTLVRNSSKGSSIQSIYPSPHTGMSSENNSPSIHFTVDKAEQNMMLMYTKHCISTCLADLEMIDTYSVVPPMVKMDDYKYSCPWVVRSGLDVDSKSGLLSFTAGVRPCNRAALRTRLIKIVQRCFSITIR